MIDGVEVQAPTTIDELEARRRWETANADGQDAAFHAAVPGPRFRAPDAAAAVARALPIVTSPEVCVGNHSQLIFHLTQRRPSFTSKLFSFSRQQLVAP